MNNGIGTIVEPYGEKSESPTIPALPGPFLREPLKSTHSIIPCITPGTARLEGHFGSKLVRLYVLRVKLGSDHGWL